MQYRVDVSSQAAADLRNLFRYILDTLRAPENAYTQLARIRKQILSLAELPMRFRAYPKHFAGYPQVRIMPVDHFEGVLHGRHSAGKSYHPSRHLWWQRYRSCVYAIDRT